MEVLLHLGEEVGEQLIVREPGVLVKVAFSDEFFLELVPHALQVLLGEEVGDLADREDVVDVLDEGLVHDVVVAEQKDAGLVLEPCLFGPALDVLSELPESIVLGDLDLVVGVAGDVGGQFR